MKLLIAREFAAGRFEKVAVVRATKTGRATIPAKIHGTVWSRFARDAAQRFAAEPAAKTVFVEWKSFKGRIDRFA